MEKVQGGVRRPQAGKKRKTNREFAERPPKTAFGRIVSVYFRRGRGMDWGFFGLIVLLVAIGLVMLYSASYPISYYENNDSTMLFRRQLIFAVIGFVLMVIASFFRYEMLKTKFMAWLILGISFAGLVYVAALGLISGGVSRWIGIGSITIQASEITKFAIIVFFAYYCDKYYAQDAKILVTGAVVLALTWALLIMEPHYSAMVIIAMLMFVMLFLGGVRIRWFIVIGVAVAAVVAILYVSGMLGYAMSRLDGWGQALTAEYGTDLYETTRQTRNSMYAIGSGGLTGLGFGESRQKYLFLPEPQNDFIFAIVCEELGFVGAMLILMLFALLIYQGIKISQQARDRFGRLLGVGTIIQIALQVILNLLVITDWMPNTGISLPFFSSGGSSLIMLMGQMGLVLSISRTANIEKL